MSTVYSRFVSFLKRLVGGILFQGVTFIVAIALIGGVYAGWTSLNRDDAATGKPVTQSMMQGIIDNLNDLNSRVSHISYMPNCRQVKAETSNSRGSFVYCAADEYALNGGGECKNWQAIDTDPRLGNAPIMHLNLPIFGTRNGIIIPVGWSVDCYSPYGTVAYATCCKVQ